jgi:hypothetical protein
MKENTIISILLLNVINDFFVTILEKPWKIQLHYFIKFNDSKPEKIAFDFLFRLRKDLLSLTSSSSNQFIKLTHKPLTQTSHESFEANKNSMKLHLPF